MLAVLRRLARASSLGVADGECRPRAHDCRCRRASVPISARSGSIRLKQGQRDKVTLQIPTQPYHLAPFAVSFPSRAHAITSGSMRADGVRWPPLPAARHGAQQSAHLQPARWRACRSSNDASRLAVAQWHPVLLPSQSTCTGWPSVLPARRTCLRFALPGRQCSHHSVELSFMQHLAQRGMLAGSHSRQGLACTSERGPNTSDLARIAAC